jgi:hypothetical protein
MNQLDLLVDRIRSDFSKYEPFMQSVMDAGSLIFNKLLDYTKEQRFIGISHKADADGKSAFLQTKYGILLFKDFLGNEMVEFVGKRIMNFSSDEEERDSLFKIKQSFGKGLYIISDLGTLCAEDVDKYLSEAIIADHHSSKAFHKRFINVNPMLYGIDGSKDLSAGMIMTLINHAVFSLIKKEFDSDKSYRKSLLNLQNKLNELSIYGAAGSAADMQNDSGLNKALYEHLEYFGLLKKIDCPFFGYATKKTSLIPAQSREPFNLKYRIASYKEFQKWTEKNLNNLSQEDYVCLNNIYDSYRHLFICINNEGFQKVDLNMPYLRQLSDFDIEKLNHLFRSIASHNLLEPVVESKRDDEKKSYKPSSFFEESDFDHFSDDLKENDKRTLASVVALSFNGINGLKTLSQQKDKVEKLKGLYKDNIISFSDPDNKDYFLSLVNRHQYFILSDKGILQNISVLELANNMTAMSKLGYGYLYDSLLDIEFELCQSSSKDKENIISEINAIKNRYNRMIFEGMREVESLLLGANTSSQLIKKGVYHLNLDSLLEKDIGSLDIMPSMIGVYGGIAAMNGLLPDSYGIIITSCRRNLDGISKISIRVTEIPKLADVDVRPLMQKFGGGGHKQAAAINYISEKEIGNFLGYVKRYDFFSGLIN